MKVIFDIIMHKRHFNEKRVKEEHARWGHPYFLKRSRFQWHQESSRQGLQHFLFEHFCHKPLKSKWKQGRQRCPSESSSEFVSDIEIPFVYLFPCNCLSTSHHLNSSCSCLKYRRPPLFFCLCVSHEVHCSELPSWCVDSPCDRVPGAHTELITGLWWKH